MALRPTRVVHDYYGNRLQTDPIAEPVTLSEIKTHLRIDDTSEDEYLTMLIKDARQELEDFTGIAMINQSWKMTLDRWPSYREQWWDGERQGHINQIYGDKGKYATVAIPRYPLVSVDTVTVYDDDGTSATVNISNTFNVDTSFLRGRLTLKNGATWPIALRESAAIEIDYTAGYGSSPTSVPSPLKRAIRQMVAYMYEHRGDGCEPKDAISASGAKTIADRYRDIEV